MRTNEVILHNAIHVEPEEGKLTEDFRKLWFLFDPQVCQRAMLNAMKEAQKEIVEHILQKAAKNSRIRCPKYNQMICSVSKDSILSLKDEIIKEINETI